MLIRRSRVRIEIEQHTLRVVHQTGLQTAPSGSPTAPVSGQNPAGVQPSPSDEPAAVHRVEPPQVT